MCLSKLVSVVAITLTNSRQYLKIKRYHHGQLPMKLFSKNLDIDFQNDI